MRNIIKRIGEFLNSPNGPMIVIGLVAVIVLIAAVVIGNPSRVVTPVNSTQTESSDSIKVDTIALDAATNLQLWNP